MALLHEDITRQIIGAGIEVINLLKPGLDEKVYENGLVLELEKRGFAVSQQSNFPIYYKGSLVGTLIPDLIVEGKVIVDTKVVRSFNDAHVAQMIGYLAITNLVVALLLNFKFKELQWKRVIREKEIG